MKKFLLSCATIMLCVLSSCQNLSEDKLLIPNGTGSARLGNQTSNSSSEDTWDWQAEGYTELYTFDNLPANVQSVLNTYFSRVSWIESRSHNYDDQTMLNMIADAALIAKAAAENLSLTNGLTAEQKAEVIAAFEGTANHTNAAYQEVLAHEALWESSSASMMALSDFDPEMESMSSSNRGRKFWRAVFRVLAAVAVTAVIIAVPVAAVAAAQVIGKVAFVKVLSTGGSAAIAALVKGVTLSSWSVSAALATGFTAGVKNAEKRWHKPWGGMIEFQFGIKIAPVYY